MNEAIQAELDTIPQAALSRAAAELSDWYRDRLVGARRPRWTEAHYAAYAATRMPATLAVCSRVFQELALRLPAAHIRSHLDLCAGPGTAAWAAMRVFPSIDRTTLFEAESHFIALGKRLLNACGAKGLSWIQANVATSQFEPSDLVTISYGLNELPEKSAREILDRAWQACRVAVVIIEPGTPAGFQTILKQRSALIEQGATIAAPCPNSLTCPMAPTSKWCHFSDRLPRTRAHRLLKSGDLGYEDEKYSYVMATKEPSAPFEARIVGYPRLLKPGVQLELCTRGEIRRVIVAKRDKDAFKLARRCDWGDTWP